MVFSENYPTWDGGERYGYNTERYYAHYDELGEKEQSDLTQINTIWKKAKDLAEKKQQAKKEQEAKKAEAEAKRQEQEAAAKRFQEYEKLKKEFEKK